MTGRQPRALGARENEILAAYLRCQQNLILSPQDFYRKWLVSQAMMARICLCSRVTVERWFATGQHFRPPELIYQQRLAQLDFLWEHFESLPKRWRRLYCQPPARRQPPDPSP